MLWFWKTFCVNFVILLLLMNNKSIRNSGVDWLLNFKIVAAETWVFLYHIFFVVAAFQLLLLYNGVRFCFMMQLYRVYYSHHNNNHHHPNFLIIIIIIIALIFFTTSNIWEVEFETTFLRNFPVNHICIEIHVIWKFWECCFFFSF